MHLSLVPEEEYLDIPSFNFSPDFQGRLSILRKLTLVLGTEKDYHVHLHQQGIESPLRRPEIMKLWSSFLQQSRYQKTFLRSVVEFPALEELFLDFTIWYLGADDRIVVCNMD